MFLYLLLFFIISCGQKPTTLERFVQLRGATVSQLVESLNRIGATPREIVSILQAIKAAGALKAKLEVL